MWWVIQALGADIVVPDDASTFTQALSQSVNGDRILLPAGVHTDGDLAISKDIEIEGVGQGLTVITGGSGATTLDVVGSVVLRDLTVRASSSRRAAITFQTGDLVAERVTFEDGNPPVSASPGGGFSIFDGTTATFTDCTFQNNAGQEGGGGIRVDDGTLVGTNLTFIDNTADDGGGLFVSAVGSATIDGALFIDNVANTEGGAVDVAAGGQADLTDLVVMGGSAPNGAGLNLEGDVVLHRTMVLGASTPGEGSAVRCAANSTVAVHNLYTCGNDGGSAVYSDSAGTFLLTNWLSVGDTTTSLVDLRTNGQDVRNASWFEPVGSQVVELRGPVSVKDGVAVNAVGAGVFASGVPTVEGVLFDNTPLGADVPGPPTNAVGSADVQGVLTDCNVARTAYAGAGVVDLGVSGVLDLDGSPVDRGHLGGPEVDPDFWSADQDGDGALVHVDCDDNDAQRSPAFSEIDCNGIDEDCDGVDGGTGTFTYWPDGDQDGFGAGAPVLACSAPSGFVDNDLDCDDSDPALTPNTLWYADTDSDGYGDAGATFTQCSQPSGYVSDATDCDDSDGGAYPGATETCDGVDEDCDGSVDEDAVGALDWYEDLDLDGYGDPAGAITIACSLGAGWSTDASDCDDSNAAVSPAGVEVCATSGVDDDCDGLVDIDDPDVADALELWVDADSDGYGTGASSPSCSVGSGFALANGDCADDDPTVNPGALEVCSGIDEDCDGLVDEADPTLDPSSLITQYVDGDGDGYGVGAPAQACTLLSGYGPQDGDCDDGDPTMNPGAIELCDGEDLNCDGVPSVETDVYPDADLDGFGAAGSTSVVDCPAPGLSTNSGDCDDTAPEVNPDADEVWYNGIDEDCDGNDRDQDEDGFALLSDCDDTDDDIYPGAPEIAGNGVDEDCDGEDAAPEDTAVPPDTAGPIDTDVVEARIRNGCGCAHGSPAFIGWLLLGAVALRRRR